MEELFKKFLDNRCSVAELKILLAFFSHPENEDVLRKLINESLTSDDYISQFVEDKYPVDKVLYEMKKQLENEKIRLITFLNNTNFQAVAMAAIQFANSINSMS